MQFWWAEDLQMISISVLMLVVGSAPLSQAVDLMVELPQGEGY